MIAGRPISEATTKYDGMRRYQASGPLIKSDKRPFLTKLAIATVSPISLAIPRSCSVPFSLYIPVLSFPFRSCLVTKMVTAFQGVGGAFSTNGVGF